MHRCLAVTALLTLGLTLANAAVQDGAGGQAAPPADQTAIAIEFQDAIAEYLAILNEPQPLSPAAVPAWRDEMQARLERLIERLDDLAVRSDGQPDVLLIKALSHTRLARLLLDERRQLDRRYDDLENEQLKRPTEATARELSQLARPRLELANRVADEYATADDVLTRALERAEAIDQRRETALIRGVVLTQSAIVNDRAIEAANAAADAGVPVEAPPPRDMHRLLDEAQRLLQNYVENTPRDHGIEWVRGQFYLGVVNYRGSLRERQFGEPYITEVAEQREQMFNDARRIFTELSDPAHVEEVLRGDGAPGEQNMAMRAYERSKFARDRYTIQDAANFYAATSNLYLGLIASIDPEMVAVDISTRERQARPFLERARELDASAAERTENPIPSLTVGVIPESIKRVELGLERARAAQQPKALNDLTLTFGLTGLYDSNVPLLGRNTEAPLDERRKRDFRVGALFRANYVLDLAALSDNPDPFLQRWQILLEGRTSPTWNLEIRDFNEQFYGGTFNLRYEIAKAGEIEGVDGLYFHNRYDYDYIMLNNEGFLRVNRYRPSLQMVALDRLIDSSVYFAYEDRNYLERLEDERFDRDGNYFSWGADTVFDLGEWVSGESLYGDNTWGRWGPRREDRSWRRPLQAAIGVEFTSNSTQGNQFDYSSAILSSGLEVPLPYGIDFAFRALWEWQDYRGNSIVDRSLRSREDFIQEYGFRVERRFYLTDYDPAQFEYTQPFKFQRVVMTLSGDIRFVIDDSNVRDRLGQSVFEYNRVIYGAGLRFDIN